MGDFFKPWKRKVGLVTLLLACVFAAAWTRSLFVEDFLGNGWRSWNGAIEQVFYTSSAGLLVITVHDENGARTEIVDHPAPPSVNNATAPASLPSAGTIGTAGSEEIQWWFPYWAITIPLTIISMWLLLSRARERESVSKSASNQVT